jgi:hypothetical protein
MIICKEQTDVKSQDVKIIENSLLLVRSTKSGQMLRVCMVPGLSDNYKVLRRCQADRSEDKISHGRLFGTVKEARA